MKWTFYVIVLISLFYQTVCGVKVKDPDGIVIETIKYDADKNFLTPGVRKSIKCISGNKNLELEWIDPAGNVVKHVPANRVYVQENWVTVSKLPLARTRALALVLVFTSVAVEDTGVWVCKAGNSKQNMSLCVIEPSRFADTSTVTADSGRSITLSCNPKGDPEPRVLWYRNGEIITDDETSHKYQVMTKYNSMDSVGLLTITSLEAEDSGDYTCEAVQESPSVDDCIHIESMNISLQVNYAPVFKDGNQTTVVYGIEGESLELVCSTNGFPIPTYKWLKDTDDTSIEFSQDKIQLLSDGSGAVLTLASNTFSWNETCRCRAANKYGEVDKSFVLVKTEKPTKPSCIQTQGKFADKIEITWNNEINFPVNSIDVQYLKVITLKGRKPMEADWIRSKLAKLIPDNVDIEGLNMTIPDLEEDTEYYVRLRAINTVGKSLWSKPILASTVKEMEVPEDLDESKNTTAASVTGAGSDSTFYGIFFAGGIAVIAIASMFLMRLV